MQVGRQPQDATISISFGTAFITWLPVALGIMLGTILRLAVFLLNGSQALAAAGSIAGAALGAVLAVSWLQRSEESSSWWGVLKLIAAWVVLSAAFRAAWLGFVIGSGWSGVTGDYALEDGQPWPIVLGLIAVAPLALRWSGRRGD